MRSRRADRHPAQQHGKCSVKWTGSLPWDIREEVMKSSGGAEGGQAQGGWSEGFAQTFLLLLLFRVGHNLAIEQ